MVDPTSRSADRSFETVEGCFSSSAYWLGECMTKIDRRTMLSGSAATFAAFTALSAWDGAHAYSANGGLDLIPDPEGLLDLPEGFSYRVIGRSGTPMSDGFLMPGRPDGMGCFAHPTEASRLVLVRNHENFANMTARTPFGEDNALLDKLDTARIYDPRRENEPFFGGTTNIVIDAASGEVVRDHLSLIGTVGNCAGGTTPWGSWLTCEEQVLKVGEEDAQREHGYVFEVPASATGLVEPVPLKAMGRFVHEACAVDPRTGTVYLTEDSWTGLFYRFLPDIPGELVRGGRLQALAIEGWDSADTRNWPREWSREGARSIKPNDPMKVRWIDMEDVEAPDADLAERGFSAGAAIFCRGEGLAYGARGDGRRAVFFNCTQGGLLGAGQVWRYEPDGGTPAEEGGSLTLIYESPSPDKLDLCDNLAITPWGDLMICEDGRNDNYLRGMTAEGVVYDFARNAHEDRAEFCGACFSPDGGTLFVNVQEPGFTYAIRGPWERLRSAG